MADSNKSFFSRWLALNIEVKQATSIRKCLDNTIKNLEHQLGINKDIEEAKGKK